MKTLKKVCNSTIGQLLATTFVLSLSANTAALAGPEDIQLKGPISADGATDIPTLKNDPNAPTNISAPGADAVMTRDMILVAPTQSANHPTTSIKDLVGNTFKVQIDRADIHFDDFVGVKITVSNETDRPLVIDGEKAQILVNGQTLTSVPVATIQQAIIPIHKTSQDFKDLVTLALPAAVTVGAAPTIRDIKENRKPFLERYGPDEVRRTVEFSRFGRRILWTQQKVQGIIYFQTKDNLSSAKLVLPVTTLFDTKDSTLVTVEPSAAPQSPAVSPTSKLQ